MKIATICKRRWRKRSFGRWTKKILWNSVHYEQSYKRSCWPTPSRQCAFGICQCIWVRATWLWCRENFTLPPNFPQSDLGRRADSRWALPQISSTFWFLPFYISAYTTLNELLAIFLYTIMHCVTCFRIRKHFIVTNNQLTWKVLRQRLLPTTAKDLMCSESS